MPGAIGLLVVACFAANSPMQAAGRSTRSPKVLLAPAEAARRRSQTIQGCRGRANVERAFALIKGFIAGGDLRLVNDVLQRAWFSREQLEQLLLFAQAKKQESVAEAIHQRLLLLVSPVDSLEEDVEL